MSNMWILAATAALVALAAFYIITAMLVVGRFA